MATPTIAPYYQYWGKTQTEEKNQSTYHLLPYHSIDVAAVCHEYLTHDPLLTDRITRSFESSAPAIPDFLSFYLALHDLGKFSESFQNQRPDLLAKLQGKKSSLSYPLRHDSIGKFLWDKDIAEHFYTKRYISHPGCHNRVAARLALKYLFNAVFGHHGSPPETQFNVLRSDLYSQNDVLAASEFIDTCWTIMIQDSDKFVEFLNNPKKAAIRSLSWVIAGISVLADWIGSNSQWFPYHQEPIPLAQYWTEIAIPNANKALFEARLIPCPVAKNRGIHYLFPDFQNGTFSPSDLQQYASMCRPGPGPHLFIIEESTGSGKTEAALTIAHQLMADGQGHGMYFGLPTMATSNALYDRISKVKDNFYEPGAHPPLILAHSARHLVDYYLDTPSRSRGDESQDDNLSLWLTDNRKKALLASMGVGTIDQALVSILPLRHQSLRLFGLWRNVLIIDEVHAYDPYITELIRCLVHAHTTLGGSTILISATLPHSIRNLFIQAYSEGVGCNSGEVEATPYPVVVHLSPTTTEQQALSPRAGTARDVYLKFLSTEEDVNDALITTARKGGCACWIRNTVQDAIEAYQQLKRAVPPDNLMLFHARFVLGDRLERERTVLNKFGRHSTEEDRESMLLVATQVVEQSLDLDFEFMVTDLAPIDLIIQRAGRLQRHSRGKRDLPILGIHSPVFEDEPRMNWFEQKFPRGASVYANHGQLWLTHKILREEGIIRTPDNARYLIESVYGGEVQTILPRELVRRDQEDQRQRQAKGLAMTNVIKFKQGYQDSGNKWSAQEEVPTRLAEPSVTLRLGIIDQDKGIIKPFYDSGPHSWDMSQVSVLRAKIGEGFVYGEELLPLVNAAHLTMKDSGKNAILVPLFRVSDNIWENRLLRADGTFLVVTYSKEIGLELYRERRNNANT